MEKYSNNLNLRLLVVISWCAIILSSLLPLVAMIEGKKVDVVSSLSYLFAGLIGFHAYQSITNVMKRIEELESPTIEINKQK